MGTDRPTDRPTDKAECRVACTRLKKKRLSTYFKVCEKVMAIWDRANIKMRGKLSITNTIEPSFSGSGGRLARVIGKQTFTKRKGETKKSKGAKNLLHILSDIAAPDFEQDKDRRADRQTDRQTDRHKHRQTEKRQKKRQTDTDRQTDRQTDIHTHTHNQSGNQSKSVCFCI